MTILEIIRQVDWKDANNKKIGLELMADAEEYLKRVEAHIFVGNEIRADAFMEVSEKQDEIRRLDRKRTEAHNRMLASFNPFLDLLREAPGFNESEYNFSNRTRIADFIALIAFETIGMVPASIKEGDIRDELAEKLHRNEVTCEQIAAEIQRLASE